MAKRRVKRKTSRRANPPSIRVAEQTEEIIGTVMALIPRMKRICDRVDINSRLYKILKETMYDLKDVPPKLEDALNDIYGPH